MFEVRIQVCIYKLLNKYLMIGNCDFQKILGMEGRFIANVYDNAEVEKVKMRRKQATNEKE
jgi:hypothetical protein